MGMNIWTCIPPHIKRLESRLVWSRESQQNRSVSRPRHASSFFADTCSLIRSMSSAFLPDTCKPRDFSHCFKLIIPNRSRCPSCSAFWKGRIWRTHIVSTYATLYAYKSVVQASDSHLHLQHVGVHPFAIQPFFVRSWCFPLGRPCDGLLLWGFNSHSFLKELRMDREHQMITKVPDALEP